MRNIKHFFVLLLSVLTAVGLCQTFTSCEPEGLVDTSDFQLYYVSVTDIAASQEPRFPIRPYWHNGEPSDFRIAGVTYEGDPVVADDAFSINSETGVISVGRTDELRIGKYGLTISCNVEGRTYVFPDALTFNLMKKVPDGIRCEPDGLVVSLADVKSASPEKELPTARIVADGESIRITGYSISNVFRDNVAVPEFEDMFAVSSEGVVSIKGGNANFIPGRYVLDFRLTTAVVDKDSEEGLFPAALTIDVTSAPESLVYIPERVFVESGSAASFSAPVLTGSLDGAAFSISGISKGGAAVQTDDIVIDAGTGAVSVKENSFSENDVYTVSVTVRNAYGEKTFTDVFSIEVVGHIEPVGDFSYSSLEKVQEAPIEHSPVSDVSGDDLRFSFVDLPEYLADLKIDEATGRVFSPRSNKLPVGYHVITVRAENTKNSKEAQFILNIKKNPNEFSYVWWGTNLKWDNGAELTKDEVQGISQFRYMDEALSIGIKESDIPSGAVVNYNIGNYGVAVVSKGDAHAIVTIDADGTIHFDKGSKPAREIIIQKVTVSVGEGEEMWVREFPVFFNFVLDNVVQGNSTVTDGICSVEYTPFVIGCAPSRGAVSNVPVVKRIDDGNPTVKFTMDYRSDFAYINLGGPESHGNDGVLGNASSPALFLNSLLDAYKVAVPTTKAAAGNRTLFSAVEDASQVAVKPLYVQRDDLRVRVNPRIWRNDDGYADGIFVGKISVSALKDDPQTGGRHNPIAIWFDEDKF